MAISSLVVDIADDEVGRATRATLIAVGRFTIGPGAGTRHAMVLDTPSAIDDTAAFEWLGALPGVRWVQVVKVYLENESLPTGAAAQFL